MERLTPGKELGFRFGLNHRIKVIEVVVSGANGLDASGTLNADQIDHLIAELSQLQNALVLSEAGQETFPPFNPLRAFEGRGEYSIARLDAISQFQVGTLDREAKVGLLVLGSSARLSGYQTSPEMARQLAHALSNAADQTPTQPKRSFDA
jgi:hypothetical protein